MRLLLFFNILTCLLPLLKCAQILGIFHVPSYSHQAIAIKLIKGLSERGHKITFVTPMKPQDEIPDIKIIELKLQEFDAEADNWFNAADLNFIQNLIVYDNLGVSLSEMILNHTTIQQILHSTQQFDLVMYDEFLNPSFSGFCHHFKAPCVTVSALGPFQWLNTRVGNPGPPSYIPHLLLELNQDMNFFQRLLNSLAYLTSDIYTSFFVLPKQNALLQKYFPHAPHLSELYYNASLLLVNSHVSVQPAVPLVPNMIDVGGLHVSEPRKLPSDLQEYLDGASRGAILFSMGSKLLSKEMSAATREAFLKSFAKLKQKVLWKWEGGDLMDKPNNVKLVKWLPQQDVLAHPNIKLFLTHGGLLSTIEAVYHGVPIVGVPVYGDQKSNVARANYSGYGVGILYSKLTEESLDEALNEVLNNPKYVENAKMKSRIMRDQPIKPLEKAIFWIEYVLRHKGAPFLRVASRKLNWCQYLLLDVVAFLGALALVASLLVVKIAKKFPRTPNDHKKTNRKKNN